jgi:predicted nucleic acid-binding Zn ribbon protein
VYIAATIMDDLIRTLPKILRAAGETEEVAEAVAMVAWRRAAGPALRGQAVPFRLYRKTLVVAVADTTWQKQLERMSGQLLFRLNSLLGQAVVTYIEFRVDPATVRAERETISPRTSPEEQEQRALRSAGGEVLSAADAIHDEELRRRFLLAAGSCIDRRESGKP